MRMRFHLKRAVECPSPGEEGWAYETPSEEG